MMREAWIIFGKEVRSLLGDGRAMIAAFVLPAVFLPVIFLAIGTAMASVQRSNEGASFALRFTGVPLPEVADRISTRLHARPLGQGPEDLAIDIAEAGEGKVSIRARYDSRSARQAYALGKIREIVNELNGEYGDHVLAESRLDRARLTRYTLEPEDVTPRDTARAMPLITVLPYFIVVFIFSGGMGLGLDCTAGEKERGSLALYLANRVSRRSLALGKTLFIMGSSVVCAASNFVGILAISLAGSGMASSLTLNMRVLVSPLVLLQFAALLLSLSSLTSSTILCVGAASRSVKEGSSYLLPIYILLVAAGAATMQVEGSRNLLFFVIPVVNVLVGVRTLLLEQLTLTQFALTIASNGLAMAVLLWAIVRLFQSEKILESA